MSTLRYLSWPFVFLTWAFVGILYETFEYFVAIWAMLEECSEFATRVSRGKEPL